MNFGLLVRQNNSCLNMLTWTLEIVMGISIISVILRPKLLFRLSIK